MSSFSEGQMHQLADAMEKAGFTAKHITALGQSSELLELVRSVLDGVAMIVPIKRPVVTEPPLDFIIRVDRSVRPTYPQWVKKVMYPELELTGPAEYNLATEVEEWLHDGQKSGEVSGRVIYDYLKRTNVLADQLGLADLWAIQAKGIQVFRKLFSRKSVFGWKSVVQDCDLNDGLIVPHLYVEGDEVVQSWIWLGYVWYCCNPALRFK